MAKLPSAACIDFEIVFDALELVCGFGWVFLVSSTIHNYLFMT